MEGKSGVGVLPSICRSQISLTDLGFNPKDLENMHIYSIGYNLGDLVMMPALYLSPEQLEYWQKTYHQEKEGMTTSQIRSFVRSLYPGSVLDFYYNRVNIHDIHSPPNLETLMWALDQHWGRLEASGHVSKLLPLIEFIKRPNVLCVHLRCGDTTIESRFDPEFTEFIRNIVGNGVFKHVIFFTGLIPGFGKTLGLERVRECALLHIKSLLLAVEGSLVVIEGSVDDHLSVFRWAKHLALHRGGISQILSLLNPNTIYLNGESGWWINKMTTPWRQQLRCQELIVT